MFRRDEAVIKAYTANKPETCAKIQQEILHFAAETVKPNGRLVYSTCTFNTHENEEVVKTFLEKHQDFSLVQIDHGKLGTSPGLQGLTQVARIWPHKNSSLGEGHFIALFERKNENITRYEENQQNKFLPPEFLLFCQTMLNKSFHGKFELRGTSLSILPQEFDLSGLRTANGGWYIGNIKKGRFTPSHALALGIKKEYAEHTINLNESNAWRYLRGETLELIEQNTYPSEEKPWILMCFNDFPLGWARLVQGRLKNQLPPGWVVRM